MKPQLGRREISWSRVVEETGMRLRIPILKTSAQKFAKSACHDAIYEPR